MAPPGDRTKRSAWIKSRRHLPQGPQLLPALVRPRSADAEPERRAGRTTRPGRNPSGQQVPQDQERLATDRQRRHHMRLIQFLNPNQKRTRRKLLLLLRPRKISALPKQSGAPLYQSKRARRDEPLKRLEIVSQL